MTQEVSLTKNGQVFTDLILTLFRVNNLMLLLGDRLTAPLGLTSARWQVLGAIAASEQAKPVAWIARDLGANRQNIQRIVNDLIKSELVVLEPNPHHRRAHLVAMTAKGKEIYAQAVQISHQSLNEIVAGLPEKDLNSANKLMMILKERLEKWHEKTHTRQPYND